MNQIKKLFNVSISGIVAAGIFMLVTPSALANGYSNVAINGRRLTVQELYNLQIQVGTTIAPGSYVVDQRGCWLNVSTGAYGCVNSVNSYSRYGSGERTSNGSWSHWSNFSEMGVGGTGDGCIYTTTGWSNC